MTSCQNDEVHPMKELPGYWTWTATCGGFTGLCDYPDKDHYKTLVISNDRYTEKTNGVITLDTTYEIINIVTSDTNWPHEKTYELKLGTGNSLHMTLMQEEDKLYITNNFMIDNYKRKY
jgi:hypothetical protein